MIDFIAIAREILNYLTVFADALIVLLVICLLFLKLSKGGSLGQAVVKLTGLFSAKVMLWVFIVSLTATLGSLFFSGFMTPIRHRLNRPPPCQIRPGSL